MAEPKRPWPKRPSPKRPWPKRPTFDWLLLVVCGFVNSFHLVAYDNEVN